MKKISRILCLLLTFVMVFSLISLTPVWAQEASAAEITTEEISTAEESTAPAENTISVECTALEESTAPEVSTASEESTVSVESTAPEEACVTEETIPQVTEPTEIADVSLGEGILFSARASTATGKYRTKAVVWNCVNEKVSYTYNGKSFSDSKLLLHSVYVGDGYQPAYCIQPGASIKAGSVYDNEGHTGADPWELLPFSKQRGVSLAILYGYPNSLDSNDLKTQIAYQLATSMIIHEIILGWRQDVHPFKCTNNSYYDVFGGGTAENPENLEITSEYYSSVHTKHLNNEDVWYAYNYISNALANHDLTPSFASKIQSQAPEYTMVLNSNGTYSITLTDTNDILSAYTFTNTADLTFTKNAAGNSLTITTTNSDLGTTTVAPTRTIPNSEGSAFLIWDASSGSQDMCTLHSPKYDPVPAYFKLKLPLGNLCIQKETSDGACLSGWQFEVYSDASCTNLVSVPHTTDTSALIRLTNLVAGDYWVKEIGSASSIVNNLYYCEESVKRVTVSAGYTATATFLNIRKPEGNLSVTKQTNTGEDIMGWRFALYYDESCTQLAYGPRATDPNGCTVFSDILVGTYWLKELGNSNAELGSHYTCTGDNPRPVTILANDTVEANFYNTMNTGTITIHKTDPYQNALGNSHFLLEWSMSGTIWKPVTASSSPGFGKCTSSGLQNGILVTDIFGNVSFEGLALGVYYRITEVKAPDGFQLLADYAYEGMLTTKDEVITINVVNTPVFTLPHTGSIEMLLVAATFPICLLTGIGTVIYLKRKEF